MMAARPPLSGDDGGAGNERAMLGFAMSKMTAADRDLARLLFSVERYGEPTAMEARFKPVPVEFLFLAFNLRDSRNRMVVSAALTKPAE
jgi:hypothetical protein